jgi:hypothetical protein
MFKSWKDYQIITASAALDRVATSIDNAHKALLNQVLRPQ